MSRNCFITGITGQDGAYLAKYLLEKGYKVYGGFRRISTPNFWRLEELGIKKDINLIEIDISDQGSLIRALEISETNQFYNLCAQSFVASSFKEPVHTANVTGMGVLNVLESIRIVNKKIKMYQASSSEMFGKVQAFPQNEKTPFYPRSPYGISKLFGHWMTINYRESYNMFCCSGILFNHESPLRGIEFVTRKITKKIAEIALKLAINHDSIFSPLVLGNLDSKRDWGYAGDFVKAMFLMLQQKEPKDFVVATGETHSVREFVELAFSYLNIPIEWKGKGIKEKGIDKNTKEILVEVSEKFYRPAEVDLLIGDYSKIKKELGWEPKVNFKELVKLMLEADVKRLNA